MRWQAKRPTCATVVKLAKPDTTPIRFYLSRQETDKTGFGFGPGRRRMTAIALRAANLRRVPANSLRTTTISNANQSSRGKAYVLPATGAIHAGNIGSLVLLFRLPGGSWSAKSALTQSQLDEH
jgi:hypothetical protein